MVLSDLEYRNIIDYLEANTTYDIGELVAKTDGQLFNMKKNIESAMYKYPNEIYAYYQAHPEHTPRYSLSELKKMKYNELSEIRQSLKIRKSKKVKTSQPAAETAKKARDVIKAQKPAEVVRNIVVSNQEHEEKEIDDLQFITREEAYAMYGEDITDEYLEERGFKLYEPIGRDYSENIEKYALIDAILEIEITIKGQSLTRETLLSLDLEELHYLYHIGSELERKLNENKGFKK